MTKQHLVNAKVSALKVSLASSERYFNEGREQTVTGVNCNLYFNKICCFCYNMNVRFVLFCFVFCARIFQT